MSSLRPRASSVVTLLAVLALCVSTQHGPVLSARDTVKETGAAENAASNSSAATPGDDEKPLKGKAKSSSTKKKARPETAKKKKGSSNDTDSGQGTTGQGNRSNDGFSPSIPGGQPNGTTGNSNADNKSSRSGQNQPTPRSPSSTTAASGANSNPSGGKENAAGASNQGAAPNQGPNPEIVNKVMDIQNRNHAALIAQKGIVGTGTGLDEDGNVVIRVYTSGADSPKIPKMIENIPVVEVLKGPTHLYQALPPQQQRQPRPTPIGISAFDDVDLSATSCAAGTLGCRLRDNHGNVYALSNNHVFAGENLTQGGVILGQTEVVQPSPGDDNCTIGIVGDRLGVLTAFFPVDITATGTNLIDCAIVKTTRTLVGTSTLPDGYGEPTVYVVRAFLGQKVQKYGRTTGFTRGIVTALNVAFPIGYAGGTANFVGQIEVTGDGFPSLGAPGDSGSLVVDMDHNPVALLFGGGGGLTDCNPINNVLKSLSAQLVKQAGAPGDTVLSVDGTVPFIPPGKEGRSTQNSP